MSKNLLFFKDATQDEWDSYVKKIPNSSFLHSWFWINYLSKFSNIIENYSFILFDSNKNLLAVCPFAVSSNNEKNINEISFSGNPCGSPALSLLKPNINRKILDEIFLIFESYIKLQEVKQINMVWDPQTINFCTYDKPHENHFELLRFQLSCSVQNMQLLKLNIPEVELFDNVSKYHRRHIRQTEKKGVKINVFDQTTEINLLNKRFSEFQKAHFLSAGKLTRPQQTWDSMLESIKLGYATLFVANIDDNPISFLLCGHFEQSSFGWSQVNIEKYEIEYSPRHLLEWNAILYYKNRGFKIYELGYRFYGDQIFYNPSDKEITISVFKERFGSLLYPQIRWTGYIENKLFNNEIEKFSQVFINSNAIVKFPKTEIS